MPDRENVIKIIEGCINDGSFCNKCDYDGCVFQHGSCEKDLLADTLALLKEQEAVVRCKDCKHGEDWGVLIACGKARGFGLTHDKDWFCADGEPKDS